MPAAAEEARILADLERELQRASDGEITGVEGLTPFGNGHSGFTYLTKIRRGDVSEDCVLRLSPPRARIAGPADVGRQGRIIASLAGSIPVPAVVACSSEPVVAERAYMLLECIEGAGFEAACCSEPDLVGLAVDTLRALHAVEPPAGVGGTAVSPRQEVERWAALLARTPTEVRGEGEKLAAELAAVAPPRSRRCWVHGDFHYGNLLFEDGRVVAVLDWELASVGSPLFDLGSLMVASVRRKYAPEPNSMGSLSVSPAGLAARYGVGADEARWFAAAACLKYAAIIGFNYELHRTGRREDPEYLALEQTMRGLPGDGREILSGIRHREPPRRSG